MLPRAFSGEPVRAANPQFSRNTGERHDTTVTDMRKMIDQSIEQVRTEITNYLQFLQRAVPGNVMGGSELSNKILNYAERNLARVASLWAAIAADMGASLLVVSNGLRLLNGNVSR
jgi:cation transport ATPase